MPALSLALLGRGTSANDGTGDTARDGALKLNRNARLLEALAKGAVISATTTAQPASPSVGDLYIIPSGKTGTDWSAMTNGSLALYAENDGANAWFEITPSEGWRVYARDTNIYYHHNGSAWAALISTAMTPVVQAASVAQGAANLNTINAINVKSATYGATGDGTTDDTAAFAAALLVGGDIFVPDGTYVISGIVLSVAGTRLFGGRGAVLKCKTGTTGTNYITLSAARCAIEGLTVNGNAAGVTYTYNRYCIKILAADCRVEGVRVYDASSMGIGGGDGAVRAIIRNNEVTASGDMGIFVNDNLASVLPAYGLCSGNTVIGWGSSTTTASGISIRGTDWRIESNYVEATASYANEQLGIEVWHGGDRSIVHNNVVRSLTYAEFGISLAAPHTSAVGNLVVGSTSWGIEAAAAGPVHITGNTIIDATGTGIAINVSASKDNDYSSIVGNIIINCTGSSSAQACIAITGTGSIAEGVRISGNTCTGTAAGIYSTLATNVQISNNHVTVGASTKAAITHVGSKALIDGNTLVLLSGATHSIGMSVSGDDVVVANNVIDGSASTTNGIVLITGYTNVVCRNNYIKDTVSNAILSQNNVASVFIHDNKSVSGGAINLQASNVGWANFVVGTTTSYAIVGVTDASVGGNGIYRAGGTDVALADGGTGAGTARGACANLLAPYIIAQSAVGVTHTGNTSETILATVTIPAGAIGPNGRLRIHSMWSNNNSGNNKTPRIRLGGIGGTNYGPAVQTTQISQIHICEISNRNSASSQVGTIGQNGNGGIGSSATALSTGAINTANAQDVVFTATLANSADSMTLESYVVEVLYGA